MNDFSTTQCSDRLNNSTNSASKLKAQKNQEVDLANNRRHDFRFTGNDSRYKRKKNRPAFDILTMMVGIFELVKN